MAIGDKLTPLERRLFKEQVIREYKLQHKGSKVHKAKDLFTVLRNLAPLNITLGVIASIGLVYYKGWDVFFQLVLTGIIWITIIASALAALSKKKD